MDTGSQGSNAGTPSRASEVVAPDADLLSVREVWLALGGHPDIRIGKADLLEALADLNRQCEGAVACREDVARYEYLLDCDFVATKQYLPGLNEKEYKDKLREKHMRASRSGFHLK